MSDNTLSYYIFYKIFIILLSERSEQSYNECVFFFYIMAFSFYFPTHKIVKMSQKTYTYIY